MVLQKVLDPHKPIPWQFFDQNGLRQTAAALLIFNRRSVAFIQPVKDATGFTWIPPQGGCLEGESVLEAARREVREELPSLRRPHRKDKFRVLWDQGLYLGSAENRATRSGQPKMLHCVALPCVYEGLTVDPRECNGAQWIYDPDTAAAILDATRLSNPTKYNIICSTINGAMEAQLLG